MKKCLVAIFLSLFMVVCFVRNHVVYAENISNDFYESLMDIHEIKKLPGRYDWMATQAEPGQSFSSYTKSQPKTVTEKRKFLYIVLLGEFDEVRLKIMKDAASYFEIYFQMSVKFLPSIDMAKIADKAIRDNPFTHQKQLLSTYIMEDILMPQLPDDAVSLIAFSADDLWPGEGWNFVFGQASVEDRVGVWSIYRNGDPNKSEEDYHLFLKRTIKTGVHEITHMFGLHHCIYFECLMNGSNHQQESDRRPFALCPVCLKKMSWSLKWDHNKRFQDLKKYHKKHGFLDIEDFFQSAVDVLDKF